MTEYVLGFLFVPGGTPDERSVALIKKRRGPEPVIGRLNGVGGKIESEETPYHAMIREFKEETGYYTRWWRKFGELRVPSYDATVHLFTCLIPEGAVIKSLTDEEVSWYNVSVLEHLNVVPNLRWMIPLALDKDEVFAAVTEPSRR